MLRAAELYEADRKAITATTYPEKDVKKAFELYKQAADCSDQESGKLYSCGPDPLACYTVATIYASGSAEIEMEHIPKNKLRSHPPHTQDERYFCNAAFQTGLIYLYGSSPTGEQVHSVTEVTADPNLALRYWKEAGILGYANACFNIGIVYLNGIGVTANEWIASKWFGRAMKLDNTGNLKVPEGVVTIDWDLTKEQQEQQRRQEGDRKKRATNSEEKKKRRRRKKVKQANRSKDNGFVGAIVTLGSIITVAGVAWYIYHRMTKNHQ
ncbi:hypothetical protein BDF20DRAFT_356413 [Mycotypha africana]|uniref:uncharacterized protein n=1 Tax=Mycotypha africana TaxID=64632 RepID=UPI002301219C|nr:uncharacterized protein BDF20DRAFT_356413 [Mycotypha africana]KAI8983953.1 hypothetical protein BDF20DRAFT_356413 [Mycotypha africana]